MIHIKQGLILSIILNINLSSISTIYSITNNNKDILDTKGSLFQKIILCSSKYIVKTIFSNT